jgi:hypothetical protein
MKMNLLHKLFGPKQHSGEGIHRLPGIIAIINKEAVQAQDTDAVAKMWYGVIEQTEALKRLYYLELTIDGYDSDKRRLCEIPEVQQWARKVAKELPGFICYLTPGAMLRFLIWLMPEKHTHTSDGNTQIEFDETTLKDFYDHHLLGALTPLLVDGLTRESAEPVVREMMNNLSSAIAGKQMGKDYVLIHQ